MVFLFNKIKSRFTKTELSWIFYDVGNSAFSMSATIVPLAFTLLMNMAKLSAERQAGINNTFGIWGLTTSISVLIMAVFSPILGTLADFKGMKKKLWVVFVILGVASCVALGLISSWIWFLVAYVFGRIGFTSANLFYDSMLTDITEDERMDLVSSNGYAWGYIGSTIPFILSIVPIVMMGQDDIWGFRIGFFITALWWAVCSLPTLFNVKQTHYLEKPERIRMGALFSQLKATFMKMKSDKSLLFFVIAYFLYIDGVYTIINMATAYGAALGLGTISMILALLLTQIVAFPSTIIAGKLAKRNGVFKLIKIFVLMYIGIGIIGVFITKDWQFWILAFLVGMCQGGIQALSRSYFGQLIPKDESNEYFGVFDIFGKFADFFGPIILFICSAIFIGTDSVGVEYGVRIGFGAIDILFICGYLLLKVSEKHSKKSADLCR